MGTSSSYKGPTGRNPLLPPWGQEPVIPETDNNNPPEQNNDNEEDQLPQPQQQTPPELNLPDVSWSGVKGIVSRLSNGRPSGSWKSAFRSYVRARGGPRMAARTASSGRATTARLGSFLAGVLRAGVVEAARNIGLTDYLGRDAQSLLAAFIDLLAPAGALLEEAIARKALSETLTDLFERYDVEGNGLIALDNIDADAMKEVITLSITNYIYERFEQELVNCVERGNVSEDEANLLADQAKEFINGEVIIDMDNIDVATFDWGGAAGNSFIENLQQIAYSLLGDRK
jgi:hypothetical protein